MFWRDAKVIFCTAFVLRLTTWLLLRVWLSFVIWNILPEAYKIDASFRRLLVYHFDPAHTAISSVNLRNFFFSFASTSFFAPSVKKCKLPKRKKIADDSPVNGYSAVSGFSKGKPQSFPRKSAEWLVHHRSWPSECVGNLHRRLRPPQISTSTRFPNVSPGLCLFGGFFCVFFTQSETNVGGRRTMMVISFTSAFFAVETFLLSMWHLMRCKWSAYRFFRLFSSRGFFLADWLCWFSRNALSVNWFMAARVFKINYKPFIVVTCSRTM